ncbi:MAG: hypothetical protein HDR10_00485 [Lachnospiraceae bacterium]|nr:hypothetical protein [Lachnospiraceae bacterium]
MKLFIGLIIAFLILIYVYTFIKIRKKRKNNIDNMVVDHYRKQYLQRKKQSESANYKNSNYETYITKYNSQVDYIEKDQLNTH